MQFINQMLSQWQSLDFKEKCGVIGGAIGLIIAGYQTLHQYQTSKDLTDEAYSFLNIGLFPEAKEKFEAAVEESSWNHEAAWGLKKAQLNDAKDDAAYEQMVKNLAKQNSNDAHVQWFFGILNATNDQNEKAIVYYQKAIAMNPEIAEAHFGLGVLYDKQQKTAAAFNEYKKAIEASHDKAKYKINLASIMFKKKMYPEALEIYQGLEFNPLAKIERAKIYWIMGGYKLAYEDQRSAMILLADENVMKNPDNQDDWYFDDQFKIESTDHKIIYAALSVSASLFLSGDKAATAKQIQQLKDLNYEPMKALLASDLNQLKQAKPNLARLVSEYQRLYL